MALIVTQERWRGDDNGIYAPYHVTEADQSIDVTAIEAQMAAFSAFVGHHGVPVSSSSYEQLSSHSWRVLVNYTVQSGGGGGPPGGTATYTFSFRAQPFVATHGLATSWTSGSTDNNHRLRERKSGGVIALDPVRIDVPPVTHTLGYTFPNATITPTYQLLLETLYGSMNSSTFRGRQPGEVLLVAAQGTQRTDGVVIEFEFAVKKRLVNFPFEGFTIPDATGFDHLTARYKTTEATINFGQTKVKTVKAIEAYAVQVWPFANLNQLGLPAA